MLLKRTPGVGGVGRWEEQSEEEGGEGSTTVSGPGLTTQDMSAQKGTLSPISTSARTFPGCSCHHCCKGMSVDHVDHASVSPSVGLLAPGVLMPSLASNHHLSCRPGAVHG